MIPFFRLLFLGCFLFIPKGSHAEDWPQFRGPNASGVSPSTKPLPTEFSSTNNMRWSYDLGEGVASPVVAGGRVFATAMLAIPAVDPKAPNDAPPKVNWAFKVVCLEEATGKILWKQELDAGPLPRITPPNSHASSTPAADGERVYVYFSTLGLLAFDAKDGKEAWRVKLSIPAYLMDWGAAGSPIVYKDLVIFNQDDDLEPFLLAADKKTGKIRWRTERPDMLGGYAIPVICEANGRTDIVVAGTGKMKGYDPETGKEIWTCNTLLRTHMVSPVVKDGVIHVSVQSYGDEKRTLKFALLEWLDTNQDGKLTRAEIPKEFVAKFDRSDKNKDGVLSGEEVDTAFQSPENMAAGGSIIQAIKGGGVGDVTKTHVIWNLKTKAPSNMSSPLVVGNQLFVVKKGGLSSCFDAATGKMHWELQRIRNLGEFFASPVAADGKIYVTGENGFVTVLAQGPQLKILAKNDIGGSIIGSPAVADGKLFFRTRDKLICIGHPEPASEGTKK